MKISFKNPNAMNINHHPNFYFSAYPLKVLNLPEEKKSYLHIFYKRENKNKKLLVNAKVLPMTLAAHDEAVKNSKEKQNTQPDNIEERDNDWFASYE